MTATMNKEVFISPVKPLCLVDFGTGRETGAAKTAVLLLRHDASVRLRQGHSRAIENEMPEDEMSSNTVSTKSEIQTQ